MSNFDCDVLIIGAGIGGLTAGALLAKKGLQVIIVEQAAQAGGQLATFEREGYIFQATNNIFSGFELGGGHERVLSELNLLVTKQPLDPAWQLILPKHRVNFCSERIALLEELKREFPKDANKIRNFFQRIDEIEGVLFDIYQHKNFIAPYTLKEKYIFNREIQSKLNRVTDGLENTGADCLRQYVRNKEFKQLLDLATYFYSLHPLEQCPVLLAAYILGIPKRGAVYFPGSSKSLINALLKQIQNRSGVIKYNSLVSKIIIDFQQAVGVQLANGDAIRAKEVIVNTSFSYLYNTLLSEHNLAGKVRKKMSFLSPEWMPVSVYLGVDSEVLPNQMKENIFLQVGAPKEIGGVNTLFINVSPEKDTDRAPDGKRAMTVTCYLPYAKWNRDANYIKQKQFITNEIIHNLGKLVTFIEEGIEYKEAATPLTYQNYLQRNNGTLTSLTHTPSGFGFNGFSSHTVFKHLWVLGEDTFPGRGSNLVSIGALNLVNLLCS